MSVSLAAISGPDAGGTQYDVPSGKDLYVPLIGTDSGQTITYTASSSNPNVQVQVLPSTDPTLTINVSGKNSSGQTFTGSMTFALFSDIAPDAVSNIISLVNDDLYNGASFYRSETGTGFQLIQGGIEMTSGKTDPNGPIKNDYNQEAAVNSPGLLVMAATSSGSATSEFFVTNPDVPLTQEPQSLNYGYAVFGQLLTGQAIYNDIEHVPTTNNNGIDYDNTPVTITSATVDTTPSASDPTSQYGVLQISEPSNFSGSTQITVTAHGSDATVAQQTFTVAGAEATAENTSGTGTGGPLVLNPVTNQTTNANTAVQFELSASEESFLNATPTFSVTAPFTQSASNPFTAAPSNVTVTVTPGSGDTATVTLTPKSGFVGTIDLVAHADYGTDNLHDALAFTLTVSPTGPVVTPSGNVNTYTVGSAAVAVDSGLTLVSNGADLTSATVAISSGTLESGDTLSFTNQNGITGSYSNGTLTLTGAASVASYQTALQSVTFSTTSNNDVTRSISIVADDNSEVSSPAAETVKVIAAPVVTPSGTTNTFTLGAAAVAVDSGVTVSSNATDLTGATVTISSGTLQSGDTLSFSTQNGITGSYSNGVLTLTGSATPAQYQTALQSIKFSTTSTNTTTRSISIVATDNSLASAPAAESVKVVVPAPTVTPSGATNTFTIGESAVAVDAGLTVSFTGADLTGATVTISSGTLQSGDTLNFTNQSGISGSYSNGVLTLTGTATVADYQAALRTITFSTTTTTSSTTRSITIVASDNSINSSPAAESVKVVIAPVLTPSGNTNTYHLGESAVAVDSGLTVTSNAADLTGATVTITPGTLQTGDTLNFTNANGITGSYSGGVLTLAGSATPAQYQAALRSVTFSTSGTNETTRSLTIVAEDNSLDSNTASESVDVSIPPPVVTASGTTNTYTVGGLAVAVDSGITVSFSSGDLTGATVTISSGTLQTGDTLNFTNQNGITGSYTNGVLTLTGTATPAQYQTALQSVTFSTTSNSSTARDLTVEVADDTLDSNSAAETVDVIGPPTVTPSGTTNTYTLGDSDVAVDSGVKVTSNAADLTGATVTISPGTLQSGDILHYTENYGIVGTYSGGVLTLSGSATPLQYQSVLQQVTFSTTSTVTGARSISIVAEDDSLDSSPAAETVDVSLPAPTVTPSGTTNTYTVGGSAVTVDSGVTVSFEGADLTSATVTISSGTLKSGDALNFTNQNGITGSYSNGVLTLTGTATPAQYQAALQSITFSTTSTSSVTRDLTVEVADDALDSNSAAETVNVIGAPTVTPSGTTNTYTLGGSNVAVDSGVTVASNAADLTGATVTITPGTLQSGDFLHYTEIDGISGSYTGGILTLSGSATPSQYQAALQSVTFSTTSTVTGARSISIVAEDDSLDSSAAAETVDVSLPAPTVTPSGKTNTYTLDGSAVAVDAGVTVSFEGADLTGATVTISSGTLQAGDTLNFTSQNGITGSYSNGVLTLTGTATPAQYQTALQSVTFSTTSTSSTARNLTVEVADDTLDSNSAAETVDVITAPVVTASGKTNTYTIGGSAVAVDSGLTVSSNATDLTGATVTISSGTLQSGDTLNFTSQNGITGSYASGVLTLSGSATPAQYQTALQSITFSSTSTNTTARSISVVADDNSLASNSAAETVDVTTASGVLSGTVFDDTNNNGVYDSGEPTLAGITVSLTGTDSDGNSVSKTAETSSSGAYSFSNLVAGTYTLSATIPTDLNAGEGSITSGSGKVSGEQISGITLSSGATDSGYDFSAKGFTSSFISSNPKVMSINLFLASSPPLSEIFNQLPTVSSIANQTTNQGTATSAIPFTVGDTLVSTDDLTVTGTSSNTTLVPDASIVFGGSGANRTVTVTPAAGESGTAMITATVSDQYGNETTTTFTVTVNAIATVTPSGTTNTFTLGGSAVAVDSGVKVSSPEADLTGATVTISSGTLQTGDTLNFTTQNGITGSYASGVLTLTGTATPAQYQTALQSVTFTTTSGDTAARSISIVAIDNSQDSNSASETVDVAVTAPVVTPSGTTNTFTVGGSAVAVDSGVKVTSADTDLTGATVTIASSTLQSGDTLTFNNQNGITGSYTGGVLTLSGSATVTEYQQALQSVNFSTTSTDTTARSISIVAIDNSEDSNTAAETVDVTVAAPVVTPSGTTNTYTLDGSPVAVDSGVTVSSADTDMTGATVTISSSTLQSGDTLSFTNQNGISGSYSNGVLTLSGSASVADYQEALESIMFSTTSSSTSTRSLTMVVLDNSLTSNSAAESVEIAAASPSVTFSPSAQSAVDAALASENDWT